MTATQLPADPATSHRPLPLAPPQTRRSGTPVIRLTWMLARPGAQSPATLVLPATAFAVTTALVLIVLGGALIFWSWTTDMATMYQFLSVIALALLIVPLASLGGAAARLSARRRDDRLATLRLLGATPGVVTRMTIIESTVVAVVGAIAGVALYYAATPLVGLISFDGAVISAEALWVSPLVVLGVVVGVAVIAALSAAIGLRQVNISPLGVRTRQSAPTMHWLRIVIGVTAIGAAFLALQLLAAMQDIVTMIIIIGVVFAIGVGILNLIGPWAISAAAKVSLRRAKSAQRLLAARTVLESPKAAWRQVSGVAMTSFVAVVAGSGMALMGAASPADAQSMNLIADIRTGIIITLAASFIMVACSVGVNQAAAILDRRDLYVSLDRLGMPRGVIESSRSRAIMSPLRLVSVGSALIGGVVVFPLVGIAMILAPLSVLVIVLCLTAGIGLVRIALQATRPVLTTVLRQPERM